MYSLIPILKEAAEQDAIFKVGKIETFGGELLNTKKIFPCDYKTYWLRPCMKVEFPAESGSVAFGEVVEVQNNEYVIIEFDREIDLDGKEFVIEHGTFIHGTLPMANMEITEKEIGLMGADGKPVKPMPIIYFQEIYRIRTQPLDSPIRIIGRDLRIYFLNDYEQDNAWKTEDHYKNIVDQMTNYSEFFVQNLRDNIKQVDNTYLRNNSYDTIPRVKTGDYVKGGNKTSIFPRNLSGAELVISVPVKKDRCSCDNGC